MIKRIIQMLLMLFILMPAQAAAPVPKNVKKQMKTIKEQLKANKATDALKTIENLRKDSLYSWNPQLLQYAVEASIILHDKENEKFYLKSKPDTTALFATTYNLIHFILLTDSAENIAVAQNASKHRFRKTNRETLSHCTKNFVAAPKYYAAKANWAETERFAALAIDLAKSPIIASYKRPITTTIDTTALALQHVNACYRQHKFDAIEKYADIALYDPLARESTYERLAYAEVERGDSTLYTQRLIEGHRLYPANMFFFSRLVDTFLRTGNNDAVLLTAAQTLEDVLLTAQNEAKFCIIDADGAYDKPSDAQALTSVRSIVHLPAHEIAQIFEARAIAYHNNGNPRLCIEEAQNILSWNPTHPRADFYIGASYYTMATSIAIPALVSDPEYVKTTRERDRLLALARPHLEAYRKNAPDDTSSWAPLLYEIYLYLNMGPEFVEISKYIN